MIIRNDKMTSWTDTLESLLHAAHDAAFGDDENTELVSETHNVTVNVIDGTAHTESRALVDVALAEGYWVQPSGFGGWEILLDWSQDANKPPNKHAEHA